MLLTGWNVTNRPATNRCSTTGRLTHFEMAKIFNGEFSPPLHEPRGSNKRVNSILTATAPRTPHGGASLILAKSQGCPVQALNMRMHDYGLLSKRRVK